MAKSASGASPANGTSVPVSVQQVLADETAQFLSDLRIYRAQFHARIGGPKGLADLSVELLKSEDVPPSIRAKLLMENLHLLGRLESEDGSKNDFSVMPDDEIEAVILSINRKEASAPPRRA